MNDEILSKKLQAELRKERREALYERVASERFLDRMKGLGMDAETHAASACWDAQRFLAAVSSDPIDDVLRLSAENASLREELAQLKHAIEQSRDPIEKLLGDAKMCEELPNTMATLRRWYERTLPAKPVQGDGT